VCAKTCMTGQCPQASVLPLALTSSPALAQAMPESQPWALLLRIVSRGMRLFTLLLAGCLAACSCHLPRNPQAKWHPSPNYSERKPQYIVLHYTAHQNIERSLATLTDPNRGERRVSSHYLIGKDGTRYQLVSDLASAWHAGAGRWGTISNLNQVSIGIELDNDGHSPFSNSLIESLLALLDELCTRWQIPRHNILGHEDFAPTRKHDPGPLFPWQRLAEAGFGLWPPADAPPAPEGFNPWVALALIGYPLEDPGAAVQAFRHRYRGMEGVQLDAEDLRILHALLSLPELASRQVMPLTR